MPPFPDDIERHTQERRIASEGRELERNTPTKKKRGGIGAILANPATQQFLFSMGHGLTSASQGRGFSPGLAQGHAAAQQMFPVQQKRAEYKSLVAAFPDEYKETALGLLEADPSGKLAANALIKLKTSGTKIPKHAKGADGFLYWIEGPNTGQRVLPGVEAREASGTEIRLADGTYVRSGLPYLDLKQGEANRGLKSSQALDAHKQLLEIEAPLFAGEEGAFNPADAGNSAFTIGAETPAIGRFVEMFKPEELRNYNTGVDRFLDAWAREMTGAAMPDSEKIFYRNVIGARPNDPVGTLKLKARNREFMANSLRESAGKGFEVYERVRGSMINPETGGAPSSSASRGGQADLIYNPETGELEPAQ